MSILPPDQVTVCVRMPKSTREALDKRARRSGVSISTIVRMMLDHYLATKGTDQHITPSDAVRQKGFLKSSDGVQGA